VHLFAGEVSKARASYQQALDLYESMQLGEDAERVRLALSGIRKDS
jgi:hypothetical protein